MSNPYVGEIRMFGGSFAPAGWAFCDGAILPISENDTLFTLIGTTFGGDGQETFGLPNLNGRTPVHVSPNYPRGEAGGVESVTLTSQQIPTHTHPVAASTQPGNQANAQDSVTADSASVQIYIEDSPDSNFANVVSVVGGSQPHENMQPFLCISYIISLFGIFPHQ